MTTALELLIAAKRAVVERGWCQGSPARDAVGRPLLSPLAEDAAAVSAIGGIMRAAWFAKLEWKSNEVRAALEAFRGSLKLKHEGLLHHDIANWCDVEERTREEVLAAFDRAIERLTPARRAVG